MSGRDGKKHKANGPKIAPESGQKESPIGSTPEPTQEAPQHASDSSFGDNGTSPVRPRSRLTPLAIAEVGLVLTAVIAVIYYFQLRSMQQSVRLTGLALEADQRPWVKLDYGETQLANSLPVIQAITITDIGKSPLLRLRAHLAMELVPNGTAPQFDWNRQHMESKVSILLPNSPNVIPATLTDANDTQHILSQAESDNIKTGKLVLISYARVAYDDTLGMGHWQQFCNWLTFPGIDQLHQTLTQTKCAEFNDTERRKAVPPSGAKNTPPQWYTSPEWWVVIIATLTGLAIAYQAREMRRATEAMRRSTEVQEVALRQWVDIENWKAVPWIPEGGVMSLHVQFDVVNPTSLPLTLNNVFVKLGEQGDKVGRKNLIPPKTSKPIVTSVKITEEQMLKWEDLKELVFIVNGYVDFDDVLDKPQIQPFSGLITCSKKGGVRFIPPYGSGLYITAPKT